MGSVSQDPESFQRLLQSHFVGAPLLFGAMAIAYWYVQIVQGDFYFKLSENNRLRSVAVTAARGVIYERQGQVLVENEPSYSLFLYRRETKNLPQSLETAIGLLNLPK